MLFLRFALLAAVVSAKPFHRTPKHASPTTDEAIPTCTATYTARDEDTCGDIAAIHKIRLYDEEANYRSGSTKCDGLLRGYGICCDEPNAPSWPPTPSAFPAGLNDTSPANITISSIIANASIAATETPMTTITKLSRAVLTYTLGTGTDTSVRVITVTHTNYDTVTLYTTIFVDPNSATSTPAPETSSTDAAPAGSPFTSTQDVTSTTDTLPTSMSSSSSSLLSSSTTSPSATSSSTSSTLTPRSSSPSASSCASVAPPAATQDGVVSGCTEWYVAVPGDYCITVANLHGIDVDTFMQWNPAVIYPVCSNLLAGDAYCVESCGGSTSSLTTSPSVPTTSAIVPTYTPSTPSGSSAPAASPTASTGSNVYRSYLGDGSHSDGGWPNMTSWIDFDSMFSSNQPQMKASCLQWGVTDDSDDEIADMKTAITTVASESGVDPRVILAVIMQESTGCVRVITTAYSVNNPGLMQSHDGTGSCNSNNAPLNVPGVTSTGGVQVPCPASEITQMVRDGTEGTSSGDGLKQLYAAQESAGYSDAQAWYRTVRAYNGGSVAASGILENGCCTASYASDIANRLTGWTTGPRSFNA